MEKQKNINEMSVIELKAVCFDIDNEIKIKQSQLSQIYRVLQDKVKEEKNEKVEEDSTNVSKTTKN